MSSIFSGKPQRQAAIFAAQQLQQGKDQGDAALEEGYGRAADAYGKAAGTLGTLDFGTETTVFDQADAEVQNAGSAITIRCSEGVAPTIAFDGGLNPGTAPNGGATRALALQGGAEPRFIGYELYSDAGRSTVIANGDPLTLPADGSAQTVNVYGRAFGGTALLPGTYTDVIGVVITL